MSLYFLIIIFAFFLVKTEKPGMKVIASYSEYFSDVFLLNTV